MGTRFGLCVSCATYASHQRLVCATTSISLERAPLYRTRRPPGALRIGPPSASHTGEYRTVRSRVAVTMPLLSLRWNAVIELGAEIP